jgi:hypothetical protein
VILQLANRGQGVAGQGGAEALVEITAFGLVGGGVLAQVDEQA